MKAPPQDYAAAVVSILIVVGVLFLAGIQRQVPDVLNTALGASLTWLYVRTAAELGSQVVLKKEPDNGQDHSPTIRL